MFPYRFHESGEVLEDGDRGEAGKGARATSTKGTSPQHSDTQFPQTQLHRLHLSCDDLAGLELSLA